MNSYRPTVWFGKRKEEKETKRDIVRTGEVEWGNKYEKMIMIGTEQSPGWNATA